MELFKESWRWIDHSNVMRDHSPLASFGTDDTLCHLVGQQLSLQTVRTWVHKQSVVLGIQDHRLPYIQEGMAFLEQQGYNPIVRNSGGLAVVLDEGVLNISLVITEHDRKISINEGFEMMVDFIKALLPEAAHKIEAYEIVGSYCPGAFDLSIGGQKFAGISQRRMKNGIAVQIYLCVEGSGGKRAELIRSFYDIALQGEETKFQYPQVNPAVMASLQELVDTSLNVVTLNQRVAEVLNVFSNEPFNKEENEHYQYYLQRIFDRNASMLK